MLNIYTSRIRQGTIHKGEEIDSMRFALEKPLAIREAQEAKKGMNAFAEIGVFVLVFAVATLMESVVALPFMLVELFSDQTVKDALASGNVTSLNLEHLSDLLQNSDMLSIVNLFATAAMIGVVLLFCKRIQKRRMRTLGFVKKNAGKEYLKGLLFGFVLFSAATLICVLTGTLTFNGISENFAVGLLVLLVVGYLIQGMNEEVLMRGYFLVSFGRRHSVWAAVIVNSLLFAAIHLSNKGIAPLAFVNLTLFGMLVSVYFVKSGNIWGAGACHSMWNLTQGCIYGISVSGTHNPSSLFSSVASSGGELINGGAFGLEGGLAVTIVLVLGILFLFWRYSTTKSLEQEGDGAPR